MDSYLVRLVWVVIAVGLGTGFQIFSTSVVNNVEDIVKTWINETYYNRHDTILKTEEITVFWSAIVSCVMIGACIGATTVFLVSERLGRRFGLIFSASFAVLGAVIASLAKVARSYEMLFIGRLLIGYSLGLGMGISSLFLTEIPPLKYRGACGSVIGLFFGLGDFLSIGLTLPEILGTEALWPVAFAIPAFPALLEIVTLLFSKESPRFLYLTKRDVVGAERSLRFYQGTNFYETRVQLEKEQEFSKKNVTKLNFLSFISAKLYRPQLLIVAGLNTASCFSGISAVMSYSTSMLEAAGLNLGDAKYASAGIGACNFILPLVTVFTVERMGRRAVALSGLSGCLAFICALVLLTGLKTHAGTHNDVLSYASVAALILYQICFGIQQPIVVFLTSEIFEQTVRGMAMTVANIIFFGLGAIQVLGYSPFEQAVGVTYSFLPFIASTALCLAFLFVKLPETKGRTVDQITSFIRSRRKAVEDPVDVKF